MSNRWWLYQRDRFPLLAFGPLIAATSFSAISFSAVLRGREALPGAGSFLVAVVSVFLFFLLLRIADEFKDHEDDARYRPYRPVPSGLVTLRELGTLGGACLLFQLGLALWLKPSLVLILIPLWVYFGLMTKEFFAREWLKARPISYLLTHMLIVPLIVFYATACDWQVEGEPPPDGLIWLLVLSFFNGVVIEVGRKIRAPQDEERGVETYSALWGPRAAALAWLGGVVLSGAAALLAANRIGTLWPTTALAGSLLIVSICTACGFMRRPGTMWAKGFERVTVLWVLFTYLSLGVPLDFRG